MMADKMICACGSVDFYSENGFYYCNLCGTQVEDMAETGVADEDFIDTDGRGAIYSQTNRRAAHSVVKSEPITLLSQSLTQPSQIWQTLTTHTQTPAKEEEHDKDAEVRVSGPQDFGAAAAAASVAELSADDYSSEIRVRYVMGIQLMIEAQCEVLVERFGVSPMICGLAGAIWMRFVAVSRVFDDGWADEVFEESEVKKQGDVKVCKPRAKYSAEPHNIHGKRAVVIWFRSLMKKIPLSTSLGVSFLACHMAREAILSTDICKWSLEGKLPYLTAFVNIEKSFGGPSKACPLSASFMFRPFQVVGSKELESQAGSIAHCIGLQLPPVNFYAIARRYLKQLSLPVEKILPHAIRIYEWSLPPDLWISANSHGLPSHVCAMSIIIVAIRILYNINGFGKWEASLSNATEKSRKENNDAKKFSSCNLNGMGTKVDKGQNSEFDTAKLLSDLQTTNDEIDDTLEYSKNLSTYLKYCESVIFAGLTPSLEDNEEEKIIEELWNFYENRKDEAGATCSNSFSKKRSGEDCFSTPTLDKKKFRKEEHIDSASLTNETSCMDDLVNLSVDGGGCSPSLPRVQTQGLGECVSAESLKEIAIKHMILDMEENGFCYIPPRVNVKRLDYLHYVRKNDAGTRTYVAHADYYILLRGCARVVQVDIRRMHAAVLKLEKRLNWMESQIDHCLHIQPPNPSSKSDEREEPVGLAMDADDSLDCQIQTNINEVEFQCSSVFSLSTSWN